MFLHPDCTHDTEGKNILGTDLTWKELEQDLVIQYGSNACLGAKAAANDIAHGKGFVARTGVIENIDENCILGDQIVSIGKLVIKIVSLRNKNNNLLNEALKAEETEDANKMRLLKQMHNAECIIFHKLSGRDLFPGPHAYITKPVNFSQRGYILMDFHEKMVTLKPFEYLERSLVYKILDVLAKFHACSQYFSETEKDQLSERVVSDIFRPLILNYNQVLTEATEKFLGQGHVRTVSHLKKSYKYLSQRHVNAELDHMDEVLDPWLGNFLFSEKNGQVYVDGLIDFQTSHFGNIGHDLSRLFCYVLPPEERLNLNDYVTHYCQSFQSHWSISRPIPFTCNQVLMACDRYFPLTAYVVALLTGAHGEERCRESEDPEGARLFLLKKISSLVEDIQYIIRSHT